MVYRIYVEKKPGFDGEAQSLRNELVSLLGIKELNGLRLLNRYDVEGIDVLGVTATAPGLPRAISIAYEAAEHIHFDKLHKRTDIGMRALKALAEKE